MAIKKWTQKKGIYYATTLAQRDREKRERDRDTKIHQLNWAKNNYFRDRWNKWIKFQSFWHLHRFTLCTFGMTLTEKRWKSPKNVFYRFEWAICIFCKLCKKKRSVSVSWKKNMLMWPITDFGISQQFTVDWRSTFLHSFGIRLLFEFYANNIQKINKRVNTSNLFAVFRSICVRIGS